MAKVSSFMMISLLLVVLASQIHAIEVARVRPWGTPGWSIASNQTFESHDDFLQVLHEKLATRNQVARHPVTDRQPRIFRMTPRRWMLLNLTGWDYDETVLVVRGDNVYLIGFRNRIGTWYALKGHQHLIPGSIPLSFGDTYSEMLGVEKEAHLELPNLTLGKQAFLEAVRTFSEYDPNDPAGEEPLKRAFAKMSVMISEAERITPIRVRIVKNWPEASNLNRNMARYVVNWGKMSHRLLCWDRHYPWWDSEDARDMEKTIHVNGPRAALKIVDLILWTGKFKPEDLDDSCIDKPEKEKEG